MKPPFKIAWEEVTPAKASEWLEKFNNGNRTLRSTTVESFAIDMKRGAWSQSHQGIAFSGGGRLLDGQHRLAAIVRSGVTIWFLICRDVPDRIGETKSTVLDSIDRGNARSVADVLKLSHGYKVQPAMISASCAVIAIIATRKIENSKRPSVSTVLSIVDRFKKPLAFISENRPTNIGLRVVPVCAAVAFAHVVSPRKSEEFYTRFASGAGLDDESPILILRNHLLNESAGRRRSSRSRFCLAELTLHALYCFIERKRMVRVPRPELCVGADWFRQRQPENVKFLQSLFPSLDQPAKAVDPKMFKLTPAAESLLRRKEMSDRINRKVAAVSVG